MLHAACHMRSGRLSTAAFSFKMFNQPAARPLVALLFIQFVSFALAQNETQSKNRGENRGPCPCLANLVVGGRRMWGSESKGYRHTCCIYAASSCGMIITTMIMTPISPAHHVYMAKLLVVIFVKYLFSNL